MKSIDFVLGRRRAARTAFIICLLLSLSAANADELARMTTRTQRVRLDNPFLSEIIISICTLQTKENRFVGCAVDVIGRNEPAGATHQIINMTAWKARRDAIAKQGGADETH